MKVARVKAVHDPSAGTAENCRLPVHCPFASKSPLIERQTRGRRIDVPAIQVGAAPRSEVLRSVVADVSFRRLQVGPISCGFDALGIDRHKFTLTKASDRRFGEQPLNDGLRPLIFALAELMLPNPPAHIDEVESRPVLVIEGTPD